MNPHQSLKVGSHPIYLGEYIHIHIPKLHDVVGRVIQPGSDLLHQTANLDNASTAEELLTINIHTEDLIEVHLTNNA